ncbi:hypothetical protein [Paraburkholderia sp. SIMBA_054]|uniref:hypothetical protein n=1 Tax=Paraburkholderia sp. SIMBA_054 TaxID=3085795 RepID=UPI00397D2D44
MKHRNSARTIKTNALASATLLLVLCATLMGCTAVQPAQAPTTRPSIVITQPKGEPGDFILCEDGRVLVFPLRHPKTCS